MVAVFSSSAAAFCLTKMLPLPTSPEEENLTPALVAAMVTVSPITDKSEQILLNSTDGIRTTAEYSVSGIPS
ncbi:hypothetical protein D3C87_2055240 [compost metagenome]